MKSKILAGLGILAIAGMVWALESDRRISSEGGGKSHPLSFLVPSNSPETPLAPSPEPPSSVPAPSPSPANPPANTCGASLSKIFTDDKFGFTVKYPASWFPSYLKYANVYDIRNYDDSKTAPTGEQTAQVTIGPHETMASREEAVKYLDTVVAGRENQKDFILKRFSIQGRPAVKMSYKYTASQAGVAGDLPKTDKMYVMNYLAVAEGAKVIVVTGIAREDASAQIFCEIDAILSSLSFSSP